MPRALSHTRNQNGFSLVEVLLAIALFSLIAMIFIGSFIYGEQSVALAGKRSRAAMLAEEGLEATRNIRDAAFADLADGTYGLTLSANVWTFSGSSDTTDIFTRTITISTIDADRKQVVATVTWPQNQQRNGSIALTTYLANWTVSSGGGGGTLPWQSPSVEASIDITGNQNGLKVDTSGDYAYIVMAAGSPNFYVINITNPASPSAIGSTTLSGKPKDIKVLGNYAYVASTDNSEELQVVDITTKTAPVLAGSYNAPGGQNAFAVAISSSTAYLGRASGGNDEFFAIDVSTPSSPTLLGSTSISNRVNGVKILGTNAYLATNDNAAELQVVDVSTPASPTVIGTLDAPTAANGLSINGFGNTILLGRSGTATGIDIIDVTTPASPSLITSFGGDIVRDITFNSGNTYAFLGTDSNSSEFQVVDISTLGSPSLYGSLDIPGGSDLNGVIYSSTKDRVFGATDSNTSEFIVIQPLP